MSDEESLITFLDDANAYVLSASYDGSTIHLDNSTTVGKANENVFLMFKTSPMCITEENLHQIMHSSLIKSPVSSLYHSLRQIYLPLLINDQKWSQELDPKVQSLITQLEKGLGTLVRRSGESGSSDDVGFSSILTPEDEAQYWADEANTNKKRDNREMASSFFAAIEPIALEFRTNDLNVDDVIDVIHNGLDDLWKLDDWEYPQNRMVHLMDNVANALTRFVQAKCNTTDLWKGPYQSVESTLQQVRF